VSTEGDTFLGCADFHRHSLTASSLNGRQPLIRRHVPEGHGRIQNSDLVSAKAPAEAVKEQLGQAVIVCPVTRQPLHAREDGTLSTPDGSRTYPVVRGVPLLLEDSKAAAEYAASSEGMTAEYSETFLKKQESWFYRLRTKDYRTQKSYLAKKNTLNWLTWNPEAVGLSIGGGPKRDHPGFVNMNIGPFANVDLVGDAHRLPYADNSVDVIYCEAVLEHLRRPEIAAREIARVLKPDRRAYICTPFLQPYHGFPHHYQNFTISGHCALMEDAGLRIVESGPCVGPVYTLRSLIGVFLANHLPKPLSTVARGLWAGIGLVIAPLDLLVNKSAQAHVLASTTYLVATKPRAPRSDGLP
jgi:SAM-dependent methyltransferase